MCLINNRSICPSVVVCVCVHMSSRSDTKTLVAHLSFKACPMSSSYNQRGSVDPSRHLLTVIQGDIGQLSHSCQTSPSLWVSVNNCAFMGCQDDCIYCSSGSLLNLREDCRKQDASLVNCDVKINHL